MPAEPVIAFLGNAFNPCGECCPGPVCGEAEFDCQAIEIEVCAYQLPDHEDVPPEEECLWFLERQDSRIDEENGTAGTIVGGFAATITKDFTETTTVISRGERVDGDCVYEVIGTSFSSSDDHIVTRDADDLVLESYLSTASSSSGPGFPCSGTYEFTDRLDSGNNDSGSYDICPDDITLLNVDATWSYLGGGVFQKIASFDDTDWITGGETETNRIAFTEPVDQPALEELLEGLDFPDDANSEACSAVIDLGDCDSGPLIRRVRYRLQLTGVHPYHERRLDEVFYPAGWDPEDAESPQPQLLASRSIIWRGPGDPEDVEDASWFTDWLDLPMPPDPGTVAIRNVRDRCTRYGPFIWRSAYGFQEFPEDE